MIETRPNELIHYGVPGMKWGVRKQQAYLKKSSTAKNKAKEYDSAAKTAKSGGDVKRANRFSKKAERSRKLADRYHNLSKKFDPNTPSGKLEQYKHDQRVKKAVANAVLSVGSVAVTAVWMKRMTDNFDAMIGG